MYIIGHIILGTHLPESRDGEAKVAAAYVAADPSRFLQEGETVEELQATAEQGELDGWLDVVEQDGWQTEYHGGGDSQIAWLGMELDSFDCTESFPLSSLKSGFSSEQLQAAREKYDALPRAVREALPPFGVYIVWSSS